MEEMRRGMYSLSNHQPSFKQSTAYLSYNRLDDDNYWFYWFTPHVPLSLLQWYSLCVSYDAVTDKMVAVLNGHKIADYVNQGYKENSLVSPLVKILIS